MDLDWIERSRLRPLKRKEFEQLAEAGAFAPGERVELLRGFLLSMGPVKAPHGYSVDRLARLFITALGDRAWVRIQGAFALSDDSEPQPDVLVYPPGDYRRENPSSAILVIEVADSSLRFDRGAKRELYAEWGVPEYWVVDVVNGVIEVFDELENGRYRRTRAFRKGESLSPGAFPDVSVRVSDVLP